MTSIYDSHVHLNNARFDEDRQAVVDRARAVGVTAQVIPGVDSASWPAIRAICETHKDLFPAYGIHPLFIGDQPALDTAQLAAWLDKNDAVAIGECGLDFHQQTVDRQSQLAYFETQLRLARERNLPVIVHARSAVEEVTLGLRRIGHLRGVLHSFSGSSEQAAQLYKLGFFIGIGGPVTYDRASRLRALVAHMPIEHLLLETDAPDQPTSQHRGERNEPMRIEEVLRSIADLRGESIETIADATCRNAQRLFGRP